MHSRLGQEWKISSYEMSIRNISIISIFIFILLAFSSCTCGGKSNSDDDSAVLNDSLDDSALKIH